MKILIAGATGAVGLPLARSLATLGLEVSGLIRADTGVEKLREIGVTPISADAFDVDSLRKAMSVIKPDAVIDQLTWLPANPPEVISALPNDTRLHREGGNNLLTAALEAGVTRYIMQSRGFYLYAPEGKLADECAKLRFDAPTVVGDSARAIGEYEARLLAATKVKATVLRYGFFYGPGTWYSPCGAVAEQMRAGEGVIIGDGDAVWSFVHIDDAVAATVAAITAAPGAYNVVDDDPLTVRENLERFARWVGAKEPKPITVEDALEIAGQEVVYYHLNLTGASNSLAKAELGFQPRPLLWKGE